MVRVEQFLTSAALVGLARVVHPSVKRFLSKASQHPAPPKMSTADAPSFYRRSLPSTCTAFSSQQGRVYFQSAMKNNGLKCFFHLMEQYSTQSEPAFCGLSTLTIVLNALSVDPRQTWKGPWRWYEESMLNCCYDLQVVKETGITLNMLTTLATCQGIVAECTIASETSLEAFREIVKKACVETDEKDVFHQALVVSYDRQTIGQTGSGHFSPIAAYDIVSDTVLILDTARFKYGAHWIKLDLLFQAMQPVDPDTGRSRGFVTLHYDSDASHLPMPLLLRSEMKQKDARKNFKKYIQTLKSVSYQDVVRFVETKGTISSVWTMTAPQVRPLGEEALILQEVRDLIATLLPKSVKIDERSCTQEGSDCRPGHCRTIQLAPQEALFVMYLACLDPTARTEIVMPTEASDRAKQQLLAEAELVWYAIDTSDQL